MNVSRLLMAAVAAATLTGSADAVILHYTLSGTDVDGTVEFASFAVDANPVVLPNNVGPGQGFRLKFLSGVFQYGSQISYLQDVQFNNADLGGGFINLDPADTTGASAFLVTYGDQLYSGAESNPMLLTGDFTLYDAYSDAPLKLNVAAVPEPASWAMLIVGFGALGGTMRRRGTVRTTARFA